MATKRSIPLQLLLRLPPALRCYAATSLRPSNGSIRLFSKTSRNLQSKPPKPSIRRSQQSQHPPAPKENPVPPPAPKVRTSDAAALTTPENMLRRFYSSKSTALLLYKSPNHTSFYLNSYIFGSILFFGSAYQGINFLFPPAHWQNTGRPSLMGRLANITYMLVLATFATTLFLAPTKLIKSVSLVKSAARIETGKGVRLVFELKHPFPIIQRLPFVPKKGGGAISADLDAVYMDRRVRASERLSFYNVPFSSAQLWTAQHVMPSAPKTILERVKGFNRSLLNIWPILTTDARRMLLREGMAYVRLGQSNWKMDLQGSELLEQGRILERVMLVDAEEVDRSFWAKLKGLYTRL